MLQHFYFKFLIKIIKENGTHLSHTDIGATDRVFVPLLFFVCLYFSQDPAVMKILSLKVNTWKKKTIKI